MSEELLVTEEQIETAQPKKSYQSFDMTSGLKSLKDVYAKADPRLEVGRLNPNLYGDYYRPLHFRRYTRQDVRKYLLDPEYYAKQLREVSTYLYERSTQYRRLITYFADLLTLDYVIVPYNVSEDSLSTPEQMNMFKAAYRTYANYLQTMNIKHEMIKVLTTAYREDVFYGYIRTSKNTFQIQRLDPDYCKITSMIDSTFIYAFDFSYFDNRPNLLNNYSDEFVEKYEHYKLMPTDRWQELESRNEFCIKITDSIYPSPIIPFGGVLDYIFRILDYTDLQETSDELDNYKVIGLKIPFSSEDGEIQLDLDLARDFYKQLCDVLPPSVGAFLTPMDFKDLSFENSATGADTNLTTEAIENFWNSAGVSSIIFGKTQTAASLAISIKADTSMAIAVGKQLERVINRILKANIRTSYKFEINILPLTIFNQEEMNSVYLKNAQYGIPCKSMAAASLGETPSTINGLGLLENTVFEYHNNWIPLQSSFTQSADEEETREVVSDDEVSESTERNRAAETNENRL